MKLIKKKSTIGILAPAGYLKKEDLKTALNFINKNDWNYILSENIFNKYEFGYNYSGTIEERTKDLQIFLDDTSIDAIWCARGGYGGAQIVDNINFEIFEKHPKFLIGYSDNTVLHQAINKLGFPSLHAITAKVLPGGNSLESYTSLKKCLETKSMNYSIESSKYNQLGESKGILIGGNLSIIYSLLGSKTITNFKNKILFLEDWNENYYHIDRIITCLKRAGVFNQLKGLIFGGFTKLDDKEENKNFDHPFDPFSSQLLDSLIGKVNYPVAYKFPSGHISDNRCLIFGQEATLKVTKEKVYLSS